MSGQPAEHVGMAYKLPRGRVIYQRSMSWQAGKVKFYVQIPHILPAPMVLLLNSLFCRNSCIPDFYGFSAKSLWLDITCHTASLFRFPWIPGPVINLRRNRAVFPMSNPQSIAVGGTIAIDNVKTPDAEAENLLGGSAAYAALAASFFTRPVSLIGIIGHDFPKPHLDMLESRGISLDGVERSPSESFTWTGEYHANMNERTTHRVGLNVLESWQVKVPASAKSAGIVVLANMSPDNQLEMLAQMDHEDPFVIADTMDLWIEIANERLHEVLPQLDLFVLNEGEARELAGTTNLVKAGRVLLEKGPKNVVVKLGEFGAILFTADGSLFRSSAYPLDAVADPTGAGDTFLGAMAGYLASIGTSPHETANLRQAVIKGSILASFTCEAFSTRKLEEIEFSHLDERLAEFRALTHW
jgi:sugar/nucleoside kinase (ribokinase family)